ncbi:uncharacterized protein [Palaemon carinicauda]|uniref:uncharacterized protein n=1 Tax=Palaemon carinicauda TaxID=392227 RepID=UPI0035B5B0D7
MSSLLKLRELAMDLGLAGDDAVEFITRQQNIEREERAQEREYKKLEAERELELRKLEERSKDRQHEIDMLAKRAVAPTNVSSTCPRLSSDEIKLLSFKEGDDFSVFLSYFERICKANGWDLEADGVIRLLPLLQGKLREVYITLPSEATGTYSDLKKELLNAYYMNSDYYRTEFRHARISPHQTFRQFGFTLCRLLNHWLETSKVNNSYESLSDFILCDQLLASVTPELRSTLKDRKWHTFDELINEADTYAAAHNLYTKLSKSSSRKSVVNNTNSLKNSDHSVVQPNITKVKRKIVCHSCGLEGHIRPQCPQNKSLIRKENPMIHNVITSSDHTSDDSGVGNVVPHKVNFVFGSTVSGSLKFENCKVNGANISTMVRDTGCTCIVVSEQLLPSIPFDEHTKFASVSDYLGRTDKFPVVKCHIACDYFTGWTEVVKAPIKFCGVLIGQVEDNDISTCQSVMTRGQVKADSTRPAPLITNKSKVLGDINVSVSDFKQEQMNCPSLQSIREKLDKYITEISKGNVYQYIIDKGFLYRKCIQSNNRVMLGVKVLVVPRKFRELIMKMAHDSLLAGHFSNCKTKDKVFALYFWPGATADILRYCRSCDICQRTTSQGRVKKAPLQTVPIITEPFAKVAVDIVGPLSPPSEDGHRFILTLVDCATRYPEAIPLKRIDSISCAEALLSIFTRIGIPKEVLSDRGRQFVSSVMEEVHKLLNIKPIFTSPYHPQANGYCERFNGVLKSIIKKICSDYPCCWHRYLPCALFAVREIPNNTLGFSPFELIYGRNVRGPLSILKELFTNQDLNKEIRNSYEYVLDLRDRLEETAQIALQNAKVNFSKYKTYYDLKTSDRKFVIGDEVLLLLPSDTNKLLSQWQGPYKVIGKKGQVDYIIEVRNKHKVFHVNMLKKYYRRATINNLQVFDEVTPFEQKVLMGPLDFVQVAVVTQCTDSPLPVLDTESGTEPDVNPYLTTEQKAELSILLDSYKDVLSDIPGCVKNFSHSIQLTTTEPVKRKPYAVPYHLREVFNREVDKLLELDIIEASISNYCSPVGLVKKSDASYRMCIDFRQLNAATVFGCEPIPTIDENLDKFSNCKYLSEIDLAKAYYQVPMEESCRKYTAFSTNRGLFQFKRMPFGLSTACSTYNRLMRQVLKNLDHVSFYFDNIFVHSSSWPEHLVALEKVFARLRSWNLTCGPSKCRFGYEVILYLGYQIGRNSLQPLPDKVQAIVDMPFPSKKRQLRSFLGSVSFYIRFIPQFGSISAPLSDYLKKNQPDIISWNSKAREAFEMLKAKLTHAPILQLADLSKPFGLRTDASDHGIGGALLQYDSEGIPFPIAYASRKLQTSEFKYSVIEKETLAIVWSVRKFQQYLYGRSFFLEIDHRPLTYLRNIKAHNARLMRWSLLLQEYQFQITHIKGAANVLADALSRNPT